MKTLSILFSRQKIKPAQLKLEQIIFTTTFFSGYFTRFLHWKPVHFVIPLALSYLGNPVRGIEDASPKSPLKCQVDSKQYSHSRLYSYFVQQ